VATRNDYKVYELARHVASAAASLSYSPGTPANWSPAPATIADALDQLAARVKTLENGTMPHPATSALSSVALSTTSAPVLASNASRLGFVIKNDGTQTAYIAFASSATTTAYTESIDPGAEYVDSTGYTGAVSGITATSTTTVRVTELTP
jgi:hypothetical protein